MVQESPGFKGLSRILSTETVAAFSRKMKQEETARTEEKAASLLSPLFYLLLKTSHVFPPYAARH